MNTKLIVDTFIRCLIVAIAIPVGGTILAILGIRLLNWFMG